MAALVCLICLLELGLAFAAIVLVNRKRFRFAILAAALIPIALCAFPILRLTFDNHAYQLQTHSDGLSEMYIALVGFGFAFMAAAGVLAGFLFRLVRWSLTRRKPAAGHG